MYPILTLSLALTGAGALADEPPPDRAPTVRDPDAEEERRQTAGQNLAFALGGAYGAYAGGATVLAANGGDNGAAVVLGGLAGAGVGALTGHLVGARTQASPDAVFFVGSTTTYGGFLGYQAGRGFIAPGAEGEFQRIGAAGVLGSVAGLGTGLLLADRSPSMGTMVRADLGLSAGLLAGSAIGDLGDLDLHDDRQRRAAVTVTTTTLGGGFALLAASKGLPEPRIGAAALDTAQGAWIGLWSPQLFGADSDPDRAWAGMRLGTGAGYLLSYGVAALGDQEAPSVALQAIGAGLGNALGGGLPLLLGGEDVSPRAAIGSMLAGSVAGQVSGAALAPRYDLGAGDVAFVGGMGAWTTWQALGWGVYTAGAEGDDVRGAGAALSLAGAGGLATLVAAPSVDLSPEAATLLLSSGTWGSGLSALTGIAAGGDAHQNLALSLGVGDLALAGTGIALASGVDPSWGTVARVNGGLAVGGALGALGTVIFVEPTHRGTPAAAATVIGSALGLTGALLLPGRDHAQPATAALGLPDRPRLPIQASWSVAPWRGEDGSTGGSVTVQGVGTVPGR